MRYKDDPRLIELENRLWQIEGLFLGKVIGYGARKRLRARLLERQWEAAPIKDEA